MTRKTKKNDKALNTSELVSCAALATSTMVMIMEKAEERAHDDHRLGLCLQAHDQVEDGGCERERVGLGERETGEDGKNLPR
jgi:hypothetical protein